MQHPAIWLHGRFVHTERAYRPISTGSGRGQGRRRRLRPRRSAAVADSLSDLAPASRYRTLLAVKSLLVFSHRIGYLPFDVGRALRLPTVRNPSGRTDPARSRTAPDTQPVVRIPGTGRSASASCAGSPSGTCSFGQKAARPLHSGARSVCPLGMEGWSQTSECRRTSALIRSSSRKRKNKGPSRSVSLWRSIKSASHSFINSFSGGVRQCCNLPRQPRR